jgi:hypothetical protein
VASVLGSLLMKSWIELMVLLTAAMFRCREGLFLSQQFEHFIIRPNQVMGIQKWRRHRTRERRRRSYKNAVGSV